MSYCSLPQRYTGKNVGVLWCSDKASDSRTKCCVLEQDILSTLFSTGFYA